MKLTGINNIWILILRNKTTKTGNKSRSTILGYIILLAVAGIAFIEKLLPAGVELLLKQEDTEGALSTIVTVMNVIFLCSIPLMFFLYALMRRKMAKEQYPHRRASANRDAQPLQGQQAVLRGQMMVFIVVVLIVIALVGWVATHYAAVSLSGN